MFDFIMMAMAFISAWLLTVQIFRLYANNSFDVKKANTFKFDVTVFEYIKSKSFGTMVAYIDNTRYEFIDDRFTFVKIIEKNIGERLSVLCVSTVEGIVIFNNEFHLYNVEEKSYKHFDKFI